MIKKLLTMLVLAFALLFYFVLPYSITYAGAGGEGQGGLSAYSDRWDDLSALKDVVEKDNFAHYKTASVVSTATTLDNLADPQKTLLMVVGVEKEYNDAEINSTEQFVWRGGTMIMADDGGFATPISEKFGVYFYNGVLWENESYGIMSGGEYVRNRTYPHINAVIDGAAHDITMNSPTALYFMEGSGMSGTGNVYANSSEKSYLDFNRNGFVDLSDKQGSMSIIVEVALGDGKAIFISDPDVFANDMLSRTNNTEFAKALIEYALPTGGQIIFDESRHPAAPMVDNAYKSLSFIMFMSSKEGVGFSLFGAYVELAPAMLSIIIFAAMLSAAAAATPNKEAWIHTYDIQSIKSLGKALPKSRDAQQEKLHAIVKNKTRIMSSLSPDDASKLTPDQYAKYIPEKSVAEFAQNPKRSLSVEQMKDIVKKVEEWKR